MDRYVCVHGHFYQPPREHPWLEAIEVQDSAYPFHDWNERVARECYAPNAASRILDSEGMVARIVSNYASISFDFGPTLLSWLQPKMPGIYEALIRADRESQELFGGHGSAIAQAYSHMILPLANGRDKRTQVVWGIRDFETRFGRRPEGMWLPETAVDLATLEVLAESGIKFTVLSPRQAKRARHSGVARWRDVTGERIDARGAYRKRLTSGRSVTLFFYDGAISNAVAFGGLLHSGAAFAERLLGAFSAEHGPQLVHIATDGETYGHHHRHGDMALAFALNKIADASGARLTVYGEYLAKHPATEEVEIVENSSWSCEHGVERWRSNCGCQAGRHPSWNQEWRAPLRSALDWLRDEVALLYEADAGRLLDDPWAARDDYISVLLDRSRDNIGDYMERNRARTLDERDWVRTLKLLELQRHAMLMYTSCGWFFEDIAGIETVQVIQYAGRVIQLAEDLFGTKLEGAFLERLEQAGSNVPEDGDGRAIYKKRVAPAEITLADAAAHYAVSAVFETQPSLRGAYAYEFDVPEIQTRESGVAALALGRIRVTSKVTLETVEAAFGALRSGEQITAAAVRESCGVDDYRKLAADALSAFDSGDLPRVLQVLERRLGDPRYSLNSLFKEERRAVLGRMLDTAVAASGGVFATMYQSEAQEMRSLVGLGSPVPTPFLTVAELYLNASLHREISRDGDIDPEIIRRLAEEASDLQVPLDRDGLGYRLSGRLRDAMLGLIRAPDDHLRLKMAGRLVSLARTVAFSVDLWEAQNLAAELMRTAYPAKKQAADAGDPESGRWVDDFVALSRQLSLRVT
ncbi:MAG: DUF3536 domain-containing protein [Chloroflexi bacterium]|nr:DUF3536 domain-containing protein [Chloroflexota bacterium]